jgi:hypothetical protein
VRRNRSGGPGGKFLSDTVISQVTLCKNSKLHDRPIDREILGIRGTRLGRQIRFNFIWLPSDSSFFSRLANVRLGRPQPPFASNFWFDKLLIHQCFVLEAHGKSVRSGVPLLFAGIPKTYKLLGPAVLRPKTGKPSGFRFPSGIDPNEDNGSIGFLGISNGSCLCGILDPFNV